MRGEANLAGNRIQYPLGLCVCWQRAMTFLPSASGVTTCLDQEDPYGTGYGYVGGDERTRPRELHARGRRRGVGAAPIETLPSRRARTRYARREWHVRMVVVGTCTGTLRLLSCVPSHGPGQEPKTDGRDTYCRSMMEEQTVRPEADSIRGLV
jgi:hypothetical protein